MAPDLDDLEARIAWWRQQEREAQTLLLAVMEDISRIKDGLASAEARLRIARGA